VEGFVQPVAGAGQVLDEPEGSAARVEVGWVGALGQVVDYLVGGVLQPLRDGLGVVEEFAQVLGVVGVQGDAGLWHDRDPFWRYAGMPGCPCGGCGHGMGGDAAGRAWREGVVSGGRLDVVALAR
jgi:hypothetical protein